MSREEMRARGWDALDVLIVTGDAYVDHPAFGAAVIGRVLEAAGFRVGIVAQPDWTKPGSFTAMGRPRLFVGVTAGAMDSMVANYTANRKLRRDDAYSPGGRSGLRPNYATIVYTNVVRQVFKGVPVILGGIEASLRRFAHYDYWKDRVRRSILLDSKADLIVAGMGETQVVEIAERLRAASPAPTHEDHEAGPAVALHGIPGTVESCPAEGFPEEIRKRGIVLADFEAVRDSRKTFLETAIQLEQAIACRAPTGSAPAGSTPAGSALHGPAPHQAAPIIQKHGDRLIVEWPPTPAKSSDLDAVYALPFQRRAHPSYKEAIPALEPVRFSVVSHRGCFGGCTFCALAPHQGKHVVSRSEEAILREIESLTRHPDFRGTISDVGGPSANMYGMGGRNLETCALCRRPSCIFPDVCPNLDASHAAQIHLLRRALEIPGVRHAFVASGIRYDLLFARGKTELTRDGREYLSLLAQRLVGGHLSVAPEHASEAVLRLMRKPSFACFLRFCALFQEESARAGKEQYLIPYFIAGFPGSTERDMREVLDWLRRENRRLQQIQDFLPGPMTLAAAMYHAGLEPARFRKIHVPKASTQRRAQRETLLNKPPARQARKRRVPRNTR
jgi:radical SAM superfamily enzyme YgiQ (UPF0313 family)